MSTAHKLLHYDDAMRSAFGSLRQRLVRIGLGSDDHHWARRTSHDILGDTAHQQMAQARAAMRAHHD